MFTGLVSSVGTVRATRPTPVGLAITIAAPWRGLAIGESVAVDGVCLTVVRRGRGTFTVQAMAATRERTLLGEYAAGRRVNLERALRAGDRLGGHLVQGHVDGVGEIIAVRRSDDAVLLDLRVPAVVADVTVPRGSIAVDGVSLTVNALPGPRTVQVALIPATRRVTTLGRAVVGRRVHLEADVIGKYVRQLTLPHSAPRRRKR
jgi:riboflavin synthase